MTPLLSLEDLHKRFPGVYALKGVDFAVRPGEVHALVGENGAGKSTLIKIAAGVYHRDQGRYQIAGRPVDIRHPRQAIDHGLAVVYQELELVPSLSVAENLFFGRLPHGRGGRVQWNALYAESATLLAEVGLAVDPQTKVGHLGVAAQQLVEIARALACDAQVIIMDEPTSALSTREIDKLFALIARLKARGVGVVYVSHKLAEVMALADRVTVLRDGERVACEQAADLDEEQLIALMVGRELGQGFPAADRTPGPCVLEVEGLTTDRVQDISFRVCAGEIVGFSGLMGAGRTELARAVMGADRRRAGTITIGGVAVPANAPPQSAYPRIGTSTGGSPGRRPFRPAEHPRQRERRGLRAILPRRSRTGRHGAATSRRTRRTPAPASPRPRANHRPAQRRQSAKGPAGPLAAQGKLAGPARR